MSVGHVVRLGLAGLLLVAGRGWAGELDGPTMSAEVRVLSGPNAPTVITLQAEPDARIEDRTPGAHPAPDAKGPASVGETFTDEVTFRVAGAPVSRQAAIEIADALVSTVRLSPEKGGTEVVVFVRQPVSYTIARPTATGAIAVTLRPRTVATAAAQPPGTRKRATPRAEGTSDQVAVDAAEMQYDQDQNVLTARGGVTLTRGETTVRADEVTYDRTTAVAEARGHVVVVDPEGTMEGESARLDLDDETGLVVDAQADMKRSPYHLTAGQVEKLGGPCYRVENGVFTTCRCGGIEPPSWSIAGKETNVTLGGLGVSKNATLRVQDTPVFWSPYFLFPANTERETGFLFPRFGYSNKRGFLYEQPFFWAIDKSNDVTITPDLETAARVGVIGEYRYQWSEQTRGIFTGAYFNERIGGSPEPLTPFSPQQENVPVNRWVVAGRHLQPFLWDSKLYLDVLRVSDDDFFREIRAFSSTVRSDIQIRSTRFTRSRLGAIKTWDDGLAQVDATAFQDLIDSQDLALNRVPRINAEHAMPFLGGVVVGRLAGEATDFQRTEGYDGLRLDVAPELTLPFNWGRYVYGSVRGQFRETAYHLTNGEQVGIFVPDNPDIATKFALGKNVLPDLGTNRNREIGEVHTTLGTELTHVYHFPYFGLEKIRHTIEPEIQYLYIPQVGRDVGSVRTRVDGNPGTLFSEGYLFDEVDAINRRNFVSYGVTTRVFGRAATATEAARAASELAEEAATSEEDDDDDDDENLSDQFDQVAADMLPQGLPLAAAPPGKPRKATAGTPASVNTSSELARASVLQGYDISRNIAGGSHLSDLDFQLRVTPTAYLGLSYANSIDLNDGRLLAQSIGMVLREPWWQPPPGRVSFQSPSAIGASYRFTADNLNAGLTPGSPENRLFNNPDPVEEVDGTAYLRLGDYMGFLFVARYSLAPTLGVDPDNTNRLITIGPQFLERDYIFRIMSRCDCWIFEIGASDRSDTKDTTIRVQFTLYGLGSIGQGPGNRTYTGLAGLQNLGYKRPWATGTGPAP